MARGYMHNPGKRIKPSKPEKPWDGVERRGKTGFSGDIVLLGSSVHITPKLLKERKDTLNLNDRDFGPRGPRFDSKTGEITFKDRRSPGRNDERKRQWGHFVEREGHRRVEGLGGKEIEQLRAKGIEFEPWMGPHQGFSIEDKRVEDTGRKNRKRKGKVFPPEY